MDGGVTGFGFSNITPHPMRKVYLFGPIYAILAGSYVSLYLRHNEGNVEELVAKLCALGVPEITRRLVYSLL